MSQAAQLRRFVVKGALFVGINVLIALGFLYVSDTGRHFEQWQTDSILYVTPKNQDFDFVCLGSSRARIFSEFKANHDFVADDLHFKFLNLAIPFGGGILPEKLFLEYFFDRGNQARTVVLFLDPFMMFSHGLNKRHRFVYYEPFRIPFLLKLVWNSFPPQRIITYVKYKFEYVWFARAPVVKEEDPRVVKQEAVDPELLRKRIDNLYQEGLDEATFLRYSKEVVAILELARRRQAHVIIAWAPTLLGPEPGAPRLKEFLMECGKNYAFDFYDWTGAIQDRTLFADHDHLNTRGFKYFVKTYLDPVLRKDMGTQE